MVPFNIQTLQRNVKFADVHSPRGILGFDVAKSFVQAHKIEKILSKLTWTYPVNNAYKANICIYHAWGQDSSLKPMSCASLCMYGADWDGKMDDNNLSFGPRKWKEFSEEFFEADPRFNTYMDKFHDFIYWVEAVQSILANATANTTARAAALKAAASKNGNAET